MSHFDILLAKKLSGGGGGGENKLPSVVDKSVTEITADDLRGITTVGRYAFYMCTRLTSVTIPNGVTIIDESAFGICTTLETVIMPNSITTIRKGAFSGTRITSIDIPENVTYIGDNVFYNDFLTEITIPRKVSYIGNNNFMVMGLRQMTLLNPNPPTIFENTFVNRGRFPIYVPAESVDAYKAAQYWSEFADNIQAIPE